MFQRATADRFAVERNKQVAVLVVEQCQTGRAPPPSGSDNQTTGDLIALAQAQRAAPPQPLPARPVESADVQSLVLREVERQTRQMSVELEALRSNLRNQEYRARDALKSAAELESRLAARPHVRSPNLRNAMILAFAITCAGISIAALAILRPVPIVHIIQPPGTLQSSTVVKKPVGWHPLERAMSRDPDASQAMAELDHAFELFPGADPGEIVRAIQQFNPNSSCRFVWTNGEAALLYRGEAPNSITASLLGCAREVEHFGQ